MCCLSTGGLRRPKTKWMPIRKPVELHLDDAGHAKRNRIGNGLEPDHVRHIDEPKLAAELCPGSQSVTRG
jgi:hypothetical protein